MFFVFPWVLDHVDMYIDIASLRHGGCVCVSPEVVDRYPYP